jgi:TatD DNase family protein
MIDSHAHLEMNAFDGDREEVLQRAKRAGVETILSLGLMDPEMSYVKAFELVDVHPELYTAIGCHPHDAKSFGVDGEQTLAGLTQRVRLVAVGEIGLDYHYNLSPPETQRDVFRRQIRVARRLGLPLIIHQREAEQDTLQILDEEKASEVGGILHSFTATRETALAAIELGFLISFSGILTFKNAAPLREVARELPLDRILVETDSPYLAPVPYRGKRNEPAFVKETAACLAELKGVPLSRVEERTDQNFRRFFPL